jgi:hypothetical protein
MRNEITKLYTCKCGCNIFSDFTPHQFEEKNVNNWNTFGLRIFAGIAVALLCINCNRIVIPPANMAGRSKLDPNVSAYGDLLKWVELHNRNIDNADKSINEKIKELENKILDMENKKCECAPPVFKTLSSLSLEEKSTLKNALDSDLSDNIYNQTNIKPNPVKTKEKLQGTKDKIGPSKNVSNEPRNKTKTKTKRIKKPKLELNSPVSDSGGHV